VSDASAVPEPLTVELSGRTAVITGASSGIGRRIALAYAERGCNVVIADIDENPRDGGTPAAIEIIERFGVDATLVHCDITASADIEAAMSAADDLGGVDIMVNNAGIFVSQPFVEVSSEDYRTRRVLRRAGCCKADARTRSWRCGHQPVVDGGLLRI